MTFPPSDRRAALTGAALMVALVMAPRIGIGQEVAPPPADSGAELQGGAEVLTRGPIHEAFADPYAQDPENALVVSKDPPEPIDEIPPEVMPEGDDVDWIPGYWGWDDERDDFIWISGVWRDMPPGQRFVPGTWEQVSGGYQWSPGFWTAAEIEQVTYLPPPPPSQEEGPNSPAPDDDHFWVPGVWQYSNNDYAWRPGYWAAAYQDWMWVPDRNVWTPDGYVYCSGFWDRSLPYRGVLYSPVYFPGYQYNGYIPQQVVSVGPMLIHLFVRPGYRHYYFGDYYGNSYAQFGIVPWLGVRQYSYYQYDPLFSFYQTSFFNGGGRGGFLNRISGWHNYYRQNPDFRPRHTLADARSFISQRNDADASILQQASLTQSINDLRKSDSHHVRLRELADSDRDRVTRSTKEMRELQKLRRDRGSREPRGEQADAGIPLPKRESQRPTVNIPQRPDSGTADQSPGNDDVKEPRRGRNREPQEQPNAVPAPERNPRPADKPDRNLRGDQPQSNPNRGNDLPREVNRDLQKNRDPRQEQQLESRRRGGRRDFQMPDAPGSDRGNDVQRIPRPSESVAPRRERRETRKPDTPRESQPQQPRSIDRPDPKRLPVQPRKEARGGGRGNAGQARQQQPQAQPSNPGGGKGKDRGGKEQP